MLREIAEETGLAAQVVPTSTALVLPYPSQVQAPYTILVEDIDDPIQGFHQHIDMIYFCRLNTSDLALADGWVWASLDELASGSALTMEGVSPQAPPEDVRVLGQKAIEIVGGASP